MANVEFKGFDEMAKHLDDIGQFTPENIAKICKAGSKVVKSKIASLTGFGAAFRKYAVAKKMRSGNYSVYYDKETSSGYRAYGAAVVYSVGRVASDKVKSSQPARPFFDTAVKDVEPETIDAMQKAFDDVMREKDKV